MMKSLMIVGADQLGGIPANLATLGYEEVIHVSGRKAKMMNKNIPAHISAILVLTDFINHNMAKAIKKKAKEKEIPVYFTKRSWCHICQALSCNECPLND